MSCYDVANSARLRFGGDFRRYSIAVSLALTKWQGLQRAALDDLENAHQQVGGIGPGRRYRTQQLDYAYIVMLAAQFQLFVRNLHDEAAQHLAATADPATAANAILAGLTQGRSLDYGNANPGTIGNNFLRIGLGMWVVLEKKDKRNKDRQKRLEQLNVWRNGVAHQSFDWGKEQLKTVGKTKATLVYIRRWRAACEALSAQFDEVVHDHLVAITGTPPW
jgi:hypothetical protein